MKWILGVSVLLAAGCVLDRAPSAGGTAGARASHTARDEDAGWAPAPNQLPNRDSDAGAGEALPLPAACRELAVCCDTYSDAKLVGVCHAVVDSGAEPACTLAAAQLCTASSPPPTTMAPVNVGATPPTAAGPSAPPSATAPAAGSSGAPVPSQPPAAGEPAPQLPAAGSPAPPAAPPDPGPAPPTAPQPPAAEPCAALAACCDTLRGEAQRTCREHATQGDPDQCTKALGARCMPAVTTACDRLRACCVELDKGETKRCDRLLERAEEAACEQAYSEYCD